MSVWSVLGIAATADEREIKRAYAKKLKLTRPDDDPAAFQALHDAYESALRTARYANESDAPAAPAYVAREASIAPASEEYPMDTARRLWDGFLPTAPVQPIQRLARIAAGDDMLSLQVRECFELCALAYCATDACPEELRAAVAEHFGWESDSAFTARHLPAETDYMLERLRAHRSYLQFCAAASSDDVVRALMADKIERLDWRPFDSGFSRKMRDLVHTVHWQHPELLAWKLNRDVFDSWERRVVNRRYFFQTAFGSLIGGALLWAGLMLGLALLKMRPDGFVAFLACEALVFALVGWFVRSPPIAVVARGADWWHRHTDDLLHQDRYLPRWQFGWIGLYALASLGLFIPAPAAATVFAVDALMLVSLVFATFANSAVLNKFGFLISTVVGVGTGNLMAHTAFAPFGVFTCMLAATVGMQLLYRGGADLFGWLALPNRALPPLRAAWLAGAVGLVAGAHAAPLPENLYAAATCLWIVAGMLLTRPSIHHFIPWVGGVFLSKFIVDALPKPSMLTSQPMSTFVFLLIAIAAFMAVNMFRAKEHQHQFS